MYNYNIKHISCKFSLNVNYFDDYLLNDIYVWNLNEQIILNILYF